MLFRSKPEAMSYVLMMLSSMKKKYQKNESLLVCIENIKVAFENHEQNKEVIYRYLNDLLPHLDEGEDRESILSLMKGIKESAYQQTLQEKFENPLGRRAESELFSYLFLNPTKAMMHSVNRVSVEILKAIQYLKDNPTKLTEFLPKLTEFYEVISCGAFKSQPRIEQIEEILKANRPDQFAEIMCIHYKFANEVFRDIPIESPDRQAIGQFAEIIKFLSSKYNLKDQKDFFEAIKKDDRRGEKLRSYISDKHIYSAELYTYVGDRGRLGDINHFYSNHLSLMRENQKEYEIDLPSRENNKWVPDCKGHNPNFSSPHVLDLIHNDTIYVSGPSGMTSLLLAQMEIMANFENIQLKQHYLSAVVTYLVGAGFHSLHEVIGPAQCYLNLVPGYRVFIPGKDKKPEAPEHHIYFKQQSKIDPEFPEQRNKAWNRYLHFFEHHYLPKRLEIKNVNLNGILSSDASEDKSSLNISEESMELDVISPSEEENKSSDFNHDSQSFPPTPKPLSIEKRRLLEEHRNSIFNRYYQRVATIFYQQPDEMKKHLEKNSPIFKSWISQMSNR